MKKVVYISGSRSDYFVMRRVLLQLNTITDLTILVTSMHLSHQFGNTYHNIEKDGLKIKKVDMLLDNDTISSMVKSLGIGIYGITQVLEDIEPDILLLEGDRGESLAGAIAAAHMNIPVVHHGGGDISGSIDDKIRSAITTFSDFHLTGNSESFKRLIRSGIPAERITVVGEPGLDDILSGEFTRIDEINKKFGLPPNASVILLIQHPDTNESLGVETEIRTILEAVAELSIPTVAVYSNADAGGRIINLVLDENSKKMHFLRVFPHVDRKDFLGLMNRCSVMLGNSSAGIVELPCFKKPFVCIGSRQKNRLRAGNTLNVNCTRKEIVDAIHFVTHDRAFIERIQQTGNPYGNECASDKIVGRILQILG